MTAVKERYHPTVVGANATVDITNEQVGGFICIASGTITISRRNGTVLVNALPVTAGIYYPIPMFIGINGGTLVAAGGASGTLLV